MKQLNQIKFCIISGCALTLLFLTTGCSNGATDESGNSSLASGAPMFTLTSNFDPLTTGWMKSGSSISISVVSVSSVAYQCRVGHVSQIDAMAFGACAPSSGAISLSKPTTGLTSGSFRADIKAVNSNGSTQQSVDFYVNPSLDTAVTCTSPKTDDQYFSVASNFLDQSIQFNSSTILKPPFISIGFPNTPAGLYRFADRTNSENYPSAVSARTLTVDSLRKRFTKNASGTLILIKRKYDQRFNPGNCRINAHRTASEDLAAAQIPTANTFANGVMACDAIVINAIGKGVCVDGTHAYWLSRSRAQLQNSGTYYSQKQKYATRNFSSSKFKHATQSQYDSTITAAQSQGDTQATDHYIFLED